MNYKKLLFTSILIFFIHSINCMPPLSKQAKEKYKQDIKKMSEHLQRLNERLIAMCEADAIITNPSETTQRVLSTWGLNSCVATILHVLFSDGSQHTAMMHSPIDKKTALSFLQLCQQPYTLHVSTPIRCINLFISTPKKIINYFDLQTMNIGDIEDINETNNEIYAAYTKALTYSIRSIFKNIDPVTVTSLQHDPTILNQNNRNIEVMLHPNNSYIKQEHTKDIIPLLTNAYIEKILNADYTLACKLIEELKKQ